MQPQNPVRNPIARQKYQEIQRKESEMKSAFGMLEDENVKTVPEAIFVRDFLPYFMGKPNLTATPEYLRSAWFLIAGTPYMPVNVVNAAGQKVIQVPPFLVGKQLNPTPEIGSGNQKLVGMGAALEEATQVSHISQQASDNMIGMALSKRVVRVAIPVTISPEWQAVFDHYAPGQSLGAPSETQSSSGDSDFEMD